MSRCHIQTLSYPWTASCNTLCKLLQRLRRLAVFLTCFFVFLLFLDSAIFHEESSLKIRFFSPDAFIQWNLFSLALFISTFYSFLSRHFRHLHRHQHHHILIAISWDCQSPKSFVIALVVHFSTLFVCNWLWYEFFFIVYGLTFSSANSRISIKPLVTFVNTFHSEKVSDNCCDFRHVLFFPFRDRSSSVEMSP